MRGTREHVLVDNPFPRVTMPPEDLMDQMNLIAESTCGKWVRLDHDHTVLWRAFGLSIHYRQRAMV